MSDSKSERTADWRELEKLVAMIQQQLSPNAVVLHNVLLDGIDSETKRQIDVLVEQNVGQYKMQIVIDCKDHSTPVDVNGIAEFLGLIRDVRAHKGALVCPSGFTKSALRLAQKHQIDLYKPVSTGNHKWRAKVTAPVLCDFRSCFMSFGIHCSAPKPMKIPYDFYNLTVYDSNGNSLGTSLHRAQGKWDSGDLPSSPGEHEHVSIFEDRSVFIDNGYNDTIEVNLTVGLLVKQNLYLGHLPINEMHGLHDQQTGLVVTNAFTTGGLNPNLVEKTWTHIEDVNSLEVEPLFRLIGYDCYGVGT